ncbi:hypothetical protein MKW94_001196 [Papaver nudicaule]|uniref:CCHC-type domain-containing protein n=1 Tax=Papaver nudicaule TaxID=74823 RepID=A0AA41UX77_PAPNU|nr:hypothetical protein [Papaver nudicaule]
MFLTKGDMSVSAYADKYTRLSKYGQALISSEEVNAKKYIKGLDPRCGNNIQMEDQSATRVRDRPPEFLARKDPAKRPMISTLNQTSFRPPIRQMGSPAGPTAIRPPTVRPLGQINFGVNNFRCYSCGEPGHLQKNCPTKPNTGPSQDGMVYAMEQVETPTQEVSRESQVLYTIMEGDKSATDQVVEGKILLFNHMLNLNGQLSVNLLSKS